MRLRNIISMTLLVSLGAGLGVACKKPAPVVDTAAEDAKRKAAEEAARKQAEEDAARKRAEEEAARRKAAEEAARKKAEEEAIARRKTEAENARKSAIEGALRDINFDFDKYSIREADKAKLQAVADVLKQYADLKVQVSGHCDERGTVEYNLALGEKRAAAAQAYLVSLGVAQDRLTTISFGKEKPKVQGKDEESYLANRRAEFAVR